MYSRAALSLFFALCIINPIVGQEIPRYKGPQECPSDETMKGYDNLMLLYEDTLSQAYDFLALGKIRPRYLYRLCPNITYDLGEGDVSPPLVAFVNNTSFECGKDGSIENNCVISGGDTHFAMAESFEAHNVLVKGITFTKNFVLSVRAIGHPNSDVTFIDCLWKGNKGLALSFAFWQPQEMRRLGQGHAQEKMKHVKNFKHSERVQRDIDHILEVADMDSPEFLPDSRNLRDRHAYPSMTTVFQDCNITENKFSEWGFLHVNSFSTTFANSIISNNVINGSVAGTGAMIAIVDGGILNLVSGTEINNNQDKFGPVIVDTFSRLYLNEENSGLNNEGFPICGGTGIFLESEGSFCLNENVTLPPSCFGTCCEFGDDSCDESTSRPSTRPSTRPSARPSTSTHPIAAPVSVIVKAITSGGPSHTLYFTMVISLTITALSFLL